MTQKASKILIIDDDVEILRAFSKILQLEGFATDTAVSGQEALSKVKDTFFDMFLIDIKLPDIEGTELLAELQKSDPAAVKIMISGQASTDNAIRSLNVGANCFLTKPVDPEVLIRNIKFRLQERDKRERITEKNVEQWVKLRISKVQSNEYSKFADDIANIFSAYGLNKTKARIYVAMNVLGAATAAEIALLSKIRREEVYRILPELEDIGIVTSKLDTPRKFMATDPQTSVEILMKLKNDLMKRELEGLEVKKADLISKLSGTSFGVYEENTIEALSRQDNVEKRMSQMVKKARSTIMFTSSTDELEKLLFAKSRDEQNDSLIEVRTVIQKGDLDDPEDFLRRLRLLSSKVNCNVDVRKVDKMPFKLLVIDRKEAIWGEGKSGKQNTKFLWTNDQMHVGILRRAFDSLWQEGESLKAQENSRGLI
jgi:CheY-like chemotaxis protein